MLVKYSSYGFFVENSFLHFIFNFAKLTRLWINYGAFKGTCSLVNIHSILIYLGPNNCFKFLILTFLEVFGAWLKVTNL